MPELQPWVAAVWRVLWTLLVNPVLYVGLALQVWEHLRMGPVQRRQFGVRTPWSLRPLVRRWFAGLVAGLAITLVLLALGVALPLTEAAGVSALALLLALVRPGWLAATVAIPAAVLIVGLAQWLPWPGAWRQTPAWQYAAGWHSAGWLLVLACASIAEAVLLSAFANVSPYPVAVRGRRGRPIGALLSQQSFVLPAAAFSPVIANGFSLAVGDPAVAWHWPWFAAGSAGCLALAFPLWVGASTTALSELPHAAQRPLVRGALAVAAFAAAGAVAANWGLPAMAPVAAALALAVRGIALWRQASRQAQREPMFVPHPGGVRVLGVVQGSWADKLGLGPGEVVVQVNQVAVHSAYDLHFALDQNPAYARLHVLDVRGELRIVGGAVYTGERHQLGLIPVPEGREQTIYAPGVGLFASLRWRLSTSQPNPDEGHPPPAAPQHAADSAQDSVTGQI